MGASCLCASRQKICERWKREQRQQARVCRNGFGARFMPYFDLLSAKLGHYRKMGWDEESVIAECAMRCRKMNSRSEALGGVAQ
jgi:hypothetical protein